jgi:hypothetical protein
MELEMNRLSLTSAAAAAALLATACGGGGDDTVLEDRTSREGRAVVIVSHGLNPVSAWAEIGFATASVAGSPAGATPEERVGAASVDLATMHLAIYDAVIAIAGTHRPYAIRPSTAVEGASMEAAAIEAAYRVLKGLFPSRGDKYEAAYTSAIGALPAGDAKTRGMAIGAEVAAGMLALRANDGRETALPPYVAGTLPGQFRPASPNLVGRGTPYIRPFLTQSHAAFVAPPPYALASAEYAADLAEVALIANASSTVRTAEQTETARFYTEPPPPWNARNLRQFASASPNLADNARLSAMLWAVQNDALGACFESKYRYNFWRPTSAIRLADTDDNAATTADPAWSPVVPTPNHPEYPAAHTCSDGSAAEVLHRFYGTKKVTFSLTSTVTGTTHTFERTDEFVRDVINGRVWGGMHFRTSGEAGAELGKNVAHWVARNHFQPIARDPGRSD